MDVKKVINSKLPIASQSINSHSTTYHYLKIYFNYLYYIGLSPFRFKKGIDGYYYIHTNYVQKMICGLIHAFVSIYGIYNFLCIKIPELRNSTSKNPTQIFTAFIYFIIMLYHVTLCHTMWSKKNHFKQVLECCEKFNLSKNAMGHHDNSWSSMKSIAVHLFIFIFIIQDAVFLVLSESGYGFDCYTFNPNPSAESTISLLNITSHQKVSDFRNEKAFSGIWAYFTKISVFAQLFFSVYSSLIISVAECFFAIATLTLRHLSKEFSQVLENEKQADSVINSHKCVRCIVEHLNEGISSLILLVLFCGLPFFSDSIITAYACTNWFYLCYILAWSGFVTLEIVAAAEANKRINRFKSWIIQHASGSGSDDISFNGSQNKFLLQYVQACEEPVALRGGNLFYVTYSSVGTGLGLLITFATIILQLKTSCGEI